MNAIVLDASGWDSVADFYRAIVAAYGALDDARPANPEELIEYLILLSGEERPPHVLRISNAQSLSEPVREHILLVASRLKHAQGGHLDKGLEDISLEILPANPK